MHCRHPGWSRFGLLSILSYYEYFSHHTLNLVMGERKGGREGEGDRMLTDVTADPDVSFLANMAPPV